MSGPVNDMDAASKESRLRNRIEINNTLILSIAALSMTWCTYQSTLWNGIQTFKLESANLAYRDAQEKTLMAMQHRLMDETVVINFMNAVLANDTTRTAFYMQRVRPELSVILSGWFDQDPLHNKKAALHPGAMKEYQAFLKHDLVEAEAIKTKAAAYWGQADQANKNADNYVLFTVVFSMIMFIGAIATKMTHLKLTFTLIVVSGLICIGILLALFLIMPLAKE
jgi:hypothetical protein